MMPFRKLFLRSLLTGQPREKHPGLKEEGDMRSPGIYWVRRSADEDWCVVEWRDRRWHRFGDKLALGGDTTFGEIGQRIIVPDNKQET